MNPPKCPNCGVPLYEVWENTYTTYTWFPKKNSYVENVGIGSLDTQCSHCGADLSDLFPEGVCNYSGKKDEPESKPD